MKNIIFVVFLFIVSLMPAFSNTTQAYDPYYPGSIVNPLRIQIENSFEDDLRDASYQYQQTLREQELRIQQRELRELREQNNTFQQKQQNTQTERYFKSAYGISNYSACRSSASGCGFESDTSDPSVWGSCLSYIQYCLERKAISESRSDQSFQNQISCPAGTVSRDGVCVSNDQACNNKFPNTVFNKINDTTGGIICDCKTGYVWNDQRNSCIVAPAVDRDKQCKEKWPNSSLMGQYCDCGNGYQWNQERTQCVATIEKSNQQLCIEKHDENWDGFRDTEGRLQCACKGGYQFDVKTSKCALMSVKSSQQICTESYGASSIWTGETNDKNGPICDCKAGYQWNQDQSSCVIIPKHKITTESSSLKKDEKSPEKAYQQSSLNSSVSDKVKIGNSSSVFLNNDESIITKDVGTTTIERKIPERESVWKRLRNWFQKKPDKQETANISYTGTSLVDIPTTEMLASTTISFIGLYKGAGLVRNCPSFDCKIIKYGAICPSTEVLFKEGDWYRVKFTERGVFDDKVNQPTVCGEDNSRILPESSWSTIEGWMPSQVIPPEIRQKFK